MSSAGPRLLTFPAYFLIFTSAVINTGIFSYFIHAFDDRNVHLVYMQVIATITLAFYLFLQFLPFLSSYAGWILPGNLVFSYLWLTAFIFSAEDYNTLGCSLKSPFETKKCGLKHAGEAFFFIGFFFLTLLVVLESLVWGVRGRIAGISTVTKDRPSTSTV